jgi:hypothetical protein
MDENLKRMFSCLCTTKTTLEKELESFLAQMKKLSESIDLGHTIKGKCDLGDYNVEHDQLQEYADQR